MRFTIKKKKSLPLFALAPRKVEENGLRKDIDVLKQYMRQNKLRNMSAIVTTISRKGLSPELNTHKP